MGRRKESLLTSLASRPWPVGVFAGVVAFIVIRFGMAAYFSGASGSRVPALGKIVADGFFTPIAWAALLACWLAAGASYLGSRQRAVLLETLTDLNSLRAMSWREFELLVGEAFRRRGYVVEETGLGGKDGGVDLVLSKDGRKELVQCKQWRSRHVTVGVVREMYGLMAHHNAHAVKIVAIGTFTPDAATFARGKPIELIDGASLLTMIREVQADQPTATVVPTPTFRTVAPPRAPVPACPRCGAAMLHRNNRRSGQPFWGCSTYPACRGTREPGTGS
jgi:restriction system protein